MSVVFRKKLCGVSGCVIWLLGELVGVECPYSGSEKLSKVKL